MSTPTAATPTPTSPRPATVGQSAAPPANQPLAVSRPVSAPVPTTRQRTPLPGPKLFGWIRLIMVVLCLLTTVVAVVAVNQSQTEQAASSTRIVHTLNLADLRANLAQAQAAALAGLLDPTSSSGQAAWNAYQDEAAGLAQSLLDAAASADDPTTLQPLTTDLFAWRDALALSWRDATTGQALTADVTEAISHYTALSQTLSQRQITVESHGATALIVISLVVTAVVVVGFVLALIVTARRTHRVLNLGLVVALLATIGQLSLLGVYTSQLTGVSYSDWQAQTWSSALAQTWQSRAVAAQTILLPGSTDTTPLSLIDSFQAELAGQSGATDQISALQDHLRSIAAASGVNQTSLILDQTPWMNLADQASQAVELWRPATSDLVVPAWPYVTTVALLGGTAVVATLAGIQRRTKEYA